MAETGRERESEWPRDAWAYDCLDGMSVKWVGELEEEDGLGQTVILTLPHRDYC